MTDSHPYSCLSEGEMFGTKQIFGAALAGAIGVTLTACAGKRPAATHEESPGGAGPTGWVVVGSAANEYTLEGAGLPGDGSGSTILLRSTAATTTGYGAATGSVSAEPFRMHWVVVSAELRPRGVADVAWLWVRADQDQTKLLFKDDKDHVVTGSSDWKQESVTLPIPTSATRIVFGLELRGGGAVEARNLRVDAGPAIDSNAPLSAAAEEELDAALSITKANSLYREKIDWERVERQTRELAGGAKAVTDTFPAIRFLLAQLGDHHSRLFPVGPTGVFQGQPNLPMAVHRLHDGIGYVSVPRYMGLEGKEISAYAARARNEIAALAPEIRCGWVVDLRNDTGGNMWPMLSGLKPLLGDAPLGYFMGPNDYKSPPWIAGTKDDSDAKVAAVPLGGAWVAVLTGPKTSSSGESVAIAFRERPHSRSFGQPTTGLTSGNADFFLPDGSLLLVTDVIDADRTGRVYGGKLDPDELVDASQDDADRVLAKATHCCLKARDAKLRRLLAHAGNDLSGKRKFLFDRSWPTAVVGLVGPARLQCGG